MVLHQVKNRQNWKMQGCLMQFLHLIFVKKLQLQRAIAPWTPTGGVLWPSGPHFSADVSILNSHACMYWLAVLRSLEFFEFSFVERFFHSVTWHFFSLLSIPSTLLSSWFKCTPYPSHPTQFLFNLNKDFSFAFHLWYCEGPTVNQSPTFTRSAPFKPPNLLSPPPPPPPPPPLPFSCPCYTAVLGGDQRSNNFLLLPLFEKSAE